MTQAKTSDNISIYKTTKRKEAIIAGNKAGGLKAKKANLEKYGPDFYKRIGAKGGANGKGPGYKGGFASDKVGEDGLTGRQRSIICGRIGGRKSKRGPAKDDIEKAEEILKQESEKDGRD